MSLLNPTLELPFCLSYEREASKNLFFLVFSGFSGCSGSAAHQGIS
ncbi:hypothetical protein [Massilia sp.]